MEELPLHPAGFRFYPTEEELISFYLRTKLHQRTSPELDLVIPVVDIYAHEPWDLPRLAGERCIGEREQWFFFVAQKEREARGGKPARTTAAGYWKATGSPGYVFSSTETETRGIGVKKTMVFYIGRAPNGRKTHWKMNEYKAIDNVTTAPQFLASSSTHPTLPIPQLRHEMSVCRVYITSGSSRAFDRRPSSVPIMRNGATAPLVVHPTIAAAATATTTADTDMTNATAGAGLVVALQETSGSMDSSGSGDHKNEDAAGSSSNMSTSIDYNKSEEEMMMMAMISGLQLDLSSDYWDCPNSFP